MSEGEREPSDWGGRGISGLALLCKRGLDDFKSQLLHHEIARCHLSERKSNALNYLCLQTIAKGGISWKKKKTNGGIIQSFSLAKSPCSVGTGESG